MNRKLLGLLIVFIGYRIEVAILNLPSMKNYSFIEMLLPSIGLAVMLIGIYVFMKRSK